jgi:hypothetical protein
MQTKLGNSKQKKGRKKYQEGFKIHLPPTKQVVQMIIEEE